MIWVERLGTWHQQNRESTVDWAKLNKKPALKPPFLKIGGMFTIPTLILFYLHEKFDRNNWPFHQSLGHWVKAVKGSTLRMFHQVNWICVVPSKHMADIFESKSRSVESWFANCISAASNPMPQWKTPPPLPDAAPGNGWGPTAQAIGISAAKMGWLRDINT